MSGGWCKVEDTRPSELVKKDMHRSVENMRRKTKLETEIHELIARCNALKKEAEDRS